MRKIIFVAFLLCVFAGCAPYQSSFQTNPIIQVGNAERARLQGEYNLLVQQARQLQNDANDHTNRKIEFLTSLNDEQLKAYQNAERAMQIGNDNPGTNESELLIAARNLKQLLSDEQFQEYANLLQEEIKLEERSQDIQQKYQTYKEQWERNTQVTMNLYLYQKQQEAIRQQQNQQAWQNYYNQQRLQQSLGGIQNAIMNQQGNVIYLPPRPNPWQGFMEGFMQGAGMPPPQP
jgi:hypothetical protein